MSLELRSGSVVGEREIRRARRQATIRAVISVVRKAFREQDPPLDTGALAAGFYRAISKLIAQQIIARKKIDITQQNIIDAIVSVSINYTQFHIVEHPNYNIYYNPGGYKNPSTPGTRSISVAEMLRSMNNNIQAELKKELRREGFDVS